MTDPMLSSDPPSQVPVLTLTLNPALDMATDVPRMVPDEKLRCSDPSLDPGGGGINVARAIHALGGESLALVALGGLTGDRLAELLRADGITFLGISGPGETRQSLTVTETATGRQFRFMMPGPVWGQADQGRVFTLLRAAGKPGGFAVISGSQPPGVPVDFPARLAAAMAGMRIVLDTSGSALIEGDGRFCAKPGAAGCRAAGDRGARRGRIGSGRCRAASVCQGAEGDGGLQGRGGGQFRRRLRSGPGPGAGCGASPGTGRGGGSGGGDDRGHRPVPPR